MNQSYLNGCDVLGAEFGTVDDVGADFFATNQPGESFIVIRVKDIGGLVAREGGSAGALAYKAAPVTVTNAVYSKMQEEFAKGLREKGVDAEVKVMANPPRDSPIQGELVVGVALGGGVVVLGLVLKSVFGGK